MRQVLRVADLGEGGASSYDIPNGRHSISEGSSAPLQRRELQKRHQQVLRQGSPAPEPPRKGRLLSDSPAQSIWCCRFLY